LPIFIRSKKLLIGLVALFLVAACSAIAPKLKVTDAWTRPAAEGNNAAVYFVVNNPSPLDLSILSASSRAARAVEIHQSMLMTADELDGMIEGGTDDMQMQDVMQMAPLSSVEILSRKSLSFEPGSYHVMLIDLRQELTHGDSLIVRLIIDDGQVLDVAVTVDER